MHPREGLSLSRVVLMVGFVPPSCRRQRAQLNRGTACAHCGASARPRCRSPGGALVITCRRVVLLGLYVGQIALGTVQCSAAQCRHVFAISSIEGGGVCDGGLLYLRPPGWARASHRTDTGNRSAPLRGRRDCGGQRLHPLQASRAG
eukprot:9501964-Pyramimonas_sp.AAC.1